MLTRHAGPWFNRDIGQGAREIGLEIMAFGKHRGNPDPQDAKEVQELIKSLPVYEPETCKHRMIVELAGRRVCNDGCGADMGPVKP